MLLMEPSSAARSRAPGQDSWLAEPDSGAVALSGSQAAPSRSGVDAKWRAQSAEDQFCALCGPFKRLQGGSRSAS
jgi:hypothetical protein